MKFFSKKESLFEHRKIHFENKPFKCYVCPKTFSKKDTLKTRRLPLHLGENPFSCQDCPRRFPRSHLNRATRQIIMESRISHVMFATRLCSPPNMPSRPTREHIAWIAHSYVKSVKRLSKCDITFLNMLKYMLVWGQSSAKSVVTATSKSTNWKTIWRGKWIDIVRLQQRINYNKGR